MTDTNCVPPRPEKNHPGHEEAFVYLHLAQVSLTKLLAHLEGLDETLHPQTADIFEDAWGLLYLCSTCTDRLYSTLLCLPGLSERIARIFKANGEPLPDQLQHLVTVECKLWG